MRPAGVTPEIEDLLEEALSEEDDEEPGETQGRHLLLQFAIFQSRVH